LEIDQINKKVKKTSTEPKVEIERAVRRKRLTPGSDLQATPMPVAAQGHEAVQRQHPHETLSSGNCTRPGIPF